MRNVIFPLQLRNLKIEDTALTKEGFEEVAETVRVTKCSNILAFKECNLNAEKLAHLGEQFKRKHYKVTG